jgi:hypothetical protein
MKSERLKCDFHSRKMETYDMQFKYIILLSAATLRHALSFVNLVRELSKPHVIFTFRFFPSLRFINANLISEFVERNTAFVSRGFIRHTEQIDVAVTFWDSVWDFPGLNLSWNNHYCNSCFLWLPSVP